MNAPPDSGAARSLAERVDHALRALFNLLPLPVFLCGGRPLQAC
jgi:hypothetical protein